MSPEYLEQVIRRQNLCRKYTDKQRAQMQAYYYARTREVLGLNLDAAYSPRKATAANG